MRIAARSLAALLLLCCASAEKAPNAISVKADYIITDQKAGKSIISGNVHITNATDSLNSDEVTLFFDLQTRRALRYEARGAVDFSLQTEDGRKLRGKANQAIFIVATETYELHGNASVSEVGKTNSVEGETIIVNRKNGFANIAGNKENEGRRPARMIFEIEQNKATP
ncbi:MAG: hypothetical protein K2H55_04455 [Helicobacter sp.]|nr:hypothetical protein [Helicobacter sp.]MDE7196301.1 hypothetical protein [Helicobacter sp.]